MFLCGLDLLKAPAHPGLHQPEWYHLLHELTPQTWANPDTPGLLRALFYDVSLAAPYSQACLSQGASSWVILHPFPPTKQASPSEMGNPRPERSRS